MARPQKQTVDYFPHNCTHGKTIYILEQRYQARGYSFWFKLLEELGKHNGHFIDLNDEAEIEFLGAKTWFQGSEILEVLNLCAKIGGIDKELWNKKIVWSDNFVDNLRSVYDKRIVSVPLKPVSDTENLVSDNINTHSKVNYSKVITPKGDKNKLMYKEPIIEVDNLGEEIVTKEKKKTFGKYPQKIATYYCNLVGKRSGSRQLPASKELMQLAQEDYPDLEMEDWYKEIIKRMKKLKDFYDKNNVTSWNLSKLAENWDLKEKEIKLDISERRIL